MKPETAQIKRNVAPLLVIAFIVAAISTGVFYGLFAGRLRAASTDAPSQPVVVAARDLARGTVLKAEDLKVSDIRWKSPIKGVFASIQKVVGATVIETIQQDEPVTERSLAMRDASSATGVSAIPTGMRAVSIHVFESSGIMGLIHRGSRVDIQAVADTNGSVSLSPILQNVEVLDVTQAQPDSPQNPRANAPVVTVLTAPHDSDLLALADSGTKLRFVLRNPLDNGSDARKPMSVPTLFRSPEALRTPAPRSGDLNHGRSSGPLHAAAGPTGLTQDSEESAIRTAGRGR
jgi:pilus assembly protein CpaB